MKKKNIRLTWTPITDDQIDACEKDFEVVVSGDYRVEVNRISERLWDYSVYFQDVKIWSAWNDDGYPKTKSEAVSRAKLAYRKHLLSNK